MFNWRIREEKKCKNRLFNNMVTLLILLMRITKIMKTILLQRITIGIFQMIIYKYSKEPSAKARKYQ